jgi:cob(I)alamin adenosyltransferase
MKVYTKTGDKGTTALFGGTRVPKHHIRIETYGTVDELNSNLGFLRDQKIGSHSDEVILRIQNRLFTIGSMLATDPKKAKLKSGKERLDIEKISFSDIELLETEIDKMDESLPQMTHFVLPGGHPAVSVCHICRSICRRAERLAVALNELEPFDEKILTYLNRLSDYLFVLARKLTSDLGVEEVKWIPEKI